ncbi:MAG: glycosyltransferase [Chloroflexi bacterium]|nr:glycosyltransferase [Chloroflexota bacterium]
MARVLMLTPYLPYPPVSGGRKGTFDLVAWLAKHGYEVTLVCFGRPEEQQFDVSPVYELCEMIVIDRPSSPSVTRAALMTLTGIRPITMRLYHTPEYQATIARLLDERAFDVIHVESFYMMQHIPAGNEVPILMSEPAIEHVVWWRHAKVANPIHQRPGIAIEALKMRLFEPRAWGRADMIRVLSDVDAEYVHRMVPGVPTRIIPHGVDVEYFHRGPGDRAHAKAIYVGDYKYFPNADAARYFIESIMPHIRAECPEFELVLVGKDPTPAMVAAGKDPNSGVIVTGLVDDLRPYLTEATVFVCPIRSGSGIRNKLMEAAACELPVVTTTIGSEGLNPIDGEHMLLADTPEDFANAVLRVINDTALAERLARQSRKWVVSQYSHHHGAAAVAVVYDELLDRR